MNYSNSPNVTLDFIRQYHRFSIDRKPRTLPIGKSTLRIYNRDMQAVILNSRQSKTPVGNDPWVRNTVDAVKTAIEQGFTIVSSIGMNTWELALWATNEFGGKGVVILPDEKKQSGNVAIEKIIDDYELTSENFAFLLIDKKVKTRSSKGWWDARDHEALNIAEAVIPVSIREKGRWSQWLESDDSKFKIINDSFRTPYTQKIKERGIEVKIPPEIPHVGDWDYITHWTRRFHEPWPGEKSADFYRAIVSSESEYPRTASASLKRIISEKRLRGSSVKIRGGTPVVAFTSLEPADAIKLMKWRSRYVRYTFEPYGIAIRKDAARSIGAKQVQYIPGKSKHQIENPEFVQGYSKGDWQKESEWRFIGDMDLNILNPDDMRILVPSHEESPEFQSHSPFIVLSLDMLRDMV